MTMKSYKCKNKVKLVRVHNDIIAAACTDGWLHVFSEDGELWSRKLTATYYRDPYTDVNIISLDVSSKNIAVGTDFMDGKVYLFSTDGDELWYRQFLTIVDCWERPEDVVAVAVNRDKIAVGSGWLNDHMYLFKLSGERVCSREVKGEIKDIKIRGENVIVGTSAALYVGDKKLDLPAIGIFVEDDRLYTHNDYGLYCVKENVEWIYEIETPKVSVSESTIAAASNKLVALSKDGEVLWEMKLRKKPREVFCSESTVYLGYDGQIEIVGDGRIVRSIDIVGTPVHLSENFVYAIEDRVLHLINF